MPDKPDNLNAHGLRGSVLIIGSVARALIQSISVRLREDRYMGTVTLEPISRTIEVNNECMLIVGLGKQICMCYNVKLSDPETKESLRVISKDEPLTIFVEFESIRII